MIQPDKPHFLTCTVVEWLPVFTRPDAVQILLDSGSQQRVNNGFQVLYGCPAYRAAGGVSGCWLACDSRNGRHKRDREYQFRQEGAHAEMIFSEPVMREKLDYIHRRYSSARNYLGEPGLIGVDPWS